MIPLMCRHFFKLRCVVVTILTTSLGSVGFIPSPCVAHRVQRCQDDHHRHGGHEQQHRRHRHRHCRGHKAKSPFGPQLCCGRDAERPSPATPASYRAKDDLTRRLPIASLARIADVFEPSARCLALAENVRPSDLLSLLQFQSVRIQV